ncbi:MAG: hypothetical protein CMO81_06500 [Waddliaceae bacterium]|nr:hypothetical protein [Waddliaceae bacterium]
MKNLVELKIGSCNRPHFTETCSGDLPFFTLRDHDLLLGLIDGLGHGKKAYDIAQNAKRVVERQNRLNLENLFNELHKELKQSNGAAAALAVIDLKSGKMHFSGVGNITACVIGHKNRCFVSVNGILGRQERSLLIQDEILKDKDRVILASDGVKSSFYLQKKKLVFEGKTTRVANQVIDNYGKMQDDASCIVFEYEAWNI